MPLAIQLPIGFILAVIIAFLARRTRNLSSSGAYAATFVGTIVFGIGGWQWTILLLTFFNTSSALSHAFKKRKQGLTEKYSKGHERDPGQVFGNGGVATACAAWHAFFPESLWPWVGFGAALAAVNADTWATELGVLNPTPPRLIKNLKKVVEKGVYRLARWRNCEARRPWIPEAFLTKDPSAELRPGQKDTDSLPPYETLDPILRPRIEEGASLHELVAEGEDPATAERVLRMVERNEYKRRQMAPGLKVTPLAFGVGWRMPIARPVDLSGER